MRACVWPASPSTGHDHSRRGGCSIVLKGKKGEIARRQVVAVKRLILAVRRQRVILSPDLAEIYDVESRALNQAVKRNADRFPPDFAFYLTRDEAMAAQRSRSHSVILNRGQNIKYLPLAFTEHGASMAATVLNSRSRIEGNHPESRTDAVSLTVRPIPRNIDTQMKTTIEISDDLLSRAKQLCRREGKTLHAVVEEGLSQALKRETTTAAKRVKPVVFRKGGLLVYAHR